MRVFITLAFIFLFVNISLAQEFSYIKASRLYKQDRFLNAGTAYIISATPIGQYRSLTSSQGWGLGIENKFSFLQLIPNLVPIYNLQATINRVAVNNAFNTDITISAQGGVNYFLPLESTVFRTYVQGLVGYGAAGSYLGSQEGADREGKGPIGTLGTGLYVNRFHVGLMVNLFKPSIQVETSEKKNMNTINLRVGFRL